MKGKFKRFAEFCAETSINFVLSTCFLYLLCLLVETKSIFFQAMVVVLSFSLLIACISGVVLKCIEIVESVRNRITKKAAAVLDPDELQL